MALVLAHVVDGHDGRVPQVGGGLGFVAEPLDVVRRSEQPGQQHLQRQEPAGRLLADLVDDAHAAAAELLEQLVAAEFTRWLQRQGQDGRRKRHAARRQTAKLLGVGEVGPQHVGVLGMRREELLAGNALALVLAREILGEHLTESVVGGQFVGHGPSLFGWHALRNEGRG